MSKFNNIEGNIELINRVAQQSADINKAVPKIKTLALADLQSHPKNTEDISDTADLELSINKNGFTDPIEVVLLTKELAEALNLKTGYVIVSGHRRKAAALKLGLKKVPCMVYEHDNVFDIENHLLMANAHRDSSKDPLLMYRRVKAHADFLRRAGYEGDIGNVIGERLGISRKSVFRRMALDNLSEPLLDMIKGGEIAETTAELLCALPEDKQMEVCDILTSEKANGIEFTRAFIKAAIDRCNGAMPDSKTEPQLKIETETDSNDITGDVQHDSLNGEVESVPESEPEHSPEPETKPEHGQTPESSTEPVQETNPVLQASSSTPVSVVTNDTVIDEPEFCENNDVCGDANSDPVEDEDYPIDPAVVNSIIENEFEIAGKRKMKQILNFLGELEDVAGLGLIEWAELKDEGEAIDTITLIRNVMVGLAEEVSVISETFELAGKDPEVDSFIEQINLLAAKSEAMIA